MLATPEGPMFDMVAPNSPDGDDDLLIDELRSTPSTGSTDVVQPTYVNPYWAGELYNLPLWHEFEPTSEVARLYSSTPSAVRRRKSPKLKSVVVTHNEWTPSSTLREIMATSKAKPMEMLPVVRQTTSFRQCKSTPNPGNALPTIPLTCEMRFRPTHEICLTMVQNKMATYIFGAEHQLEEVLFKYNEFDMARGVFMSLCPEYTVHPDILNTTCMMGSIIVLKSIAPQTWFLPSVFARDALCEKSTEQLQNSYQKIWMHETNGLHH
ncbi:hypothetical protein S83_001081, partial [Arachis hypogaea]